MFQAFQKPNRLLLAVLFSVLAADLATRSFERGPMISSDFATKTPEVDNTRPTRSAPNRKPSQPKSSEASRPAARPTPKEDPKPTMAPEVSRPDEGAICAARIRDQGFCDLEYKSEGAMVRTTVKDGVQKKPDLSGTVDDGPKGTIDTPVKVYTVFCEVCGGEPKTITVAKSEGLESVGSKILDAAKNLVTERKKQSAASNDNRARIASSRDQADIDECRKKKLDDGGFKTLSSSDQLSCLQDRCSSLDDDDKNKKRSCSRLTTKLDSLLKNGNEEQRADALEVVKSLADEDVPTDVKRQAKIMAIGGKYQDRILKISEQMAKIPTDSVAGQFARTRLSAQLLQIDDEMRREFSFAGQSAMSRIGQNGGFDEYNSILDWQTSLMTTSALASQNPQTLLDRSGFQGRAHLDFDLDPSTRLLRARTGDNILAGMTAQLPRYGSSATDYIQEAINRINSAPTRIAPESFPGARGSPSGPDLNPGSRQPVPLPGRNASQPRGIPGVGSRIGGM